MRCHEFAAGKRCVRSKANAKKGSQTRTPSPLLSKDHNANASRVRLWRACADVVMLSMSAIVRHMPKCHALTPSQ